MYCVTRKGSTIANTFDTLEGAKKYCRLGSYEADIYKKIGYSFKPMEFVIDKEVE